MTDNKDVMQDSSSAPPAYTTGYPAQPYTGQPGYYGSQPLTNQPGYPPQPVHGTTTTVVMPPTQAVIVPAGPRPSNWMALSIFSCLCCVWPIGLAAIVVSLMVDSSYDSGDYVSARKYSNIAKWLGIASIICGVAVIIIIIIWYAVAVASVTSAASGASSSYT